MNERNEFIQYGRQWLMDNDIPDQMFYSDLIFNAWFCDKRIKNCTLDIYDETKSVVINIYLGKFWSIFARKKKLSNKIMQIVYEKLSQSYNSIEVRFRLWTKETTTKKINP